MGLIIWVMPLLASCSSQPPVAAAAPAPNQSTAAIPITGLAAPTPSAPPKANIAVAKSGLADPTTTAPLCATPANLTPEVTEGPFFKANSPERTSLIESGTTGTHLTLTGYVLTADCSPVANALLDFWQANAQGVYDNSGYTLRGHQFTDVNGHYHLETIIPGIYTGRTEHIHVKVQAPGGPILTTQLFFPGVPDNQSDSIYNPALLIKVLENSGSMQAAYNFNISLK
jgi:protocatechuate 3,4-dioxygenase beta subunit